MATYTVVLLVTFLVNAFPSSAKPNTDLFRSYHKTQDNRDGDMLQKPVWFDGYKPTSVPEFRKLLEQYHQHQELSTVKGDLSLKIDIKCDSCKVIFFILQDLLAQHAPQGKIADIITTVCIKLKIEHERVCTGIVQMFKTEVLTVFDKIALSYEEVCGVLLGSYCATPRNPTAPWNITLPNVPKPKPSPPKEPKAGSPRVRILHLTDIHLDFQYKPGANAECGEPVCCRDNDGPAHGSPAGLWGDYRNCDTSPKLFENMLKNIQTNHKFDMIYWTGDLPGHYVWNQTEAGGISLQDYVTKMFLEYFPKTLVFSSVGNHEGVPVNSFPMPFIKESSIDWLYGTLAKNWSHWLPKSSQETTKRGGYFSFLYKPGFRIISVNTNYCNNQNWWLLLNETDPIGELEWLIGELQKAEDIGEKVHIVGHIPPGHPSCLKSWSWNYYKIVNRYENTISAQFFGHTHFDHIEIFYDEETLTRPTSVAYIGPSVTPYTNLNPGYRIYEVDGTYPNSSWGVLDHENYVMNLTKANQTNIPEWELEYKASKAYNVTSLFPVVAQEILELLEKDDSFLQLFYRYKYKLHPPAPSCDPDCRKTLLCDIKSARSHDPHLCKTYISEEEFRVKASAAHVESLC